MMPATVDSSVHPRMRGERRQLHPRRCTAVIRFIPACAGNARLMMPRGVGRCLARFIPACAGNALAEVSTGSSPHARGTRVTESVCSGSSPHARGTQHAASNGARCHRFIPACAGNASSWALQLCTAGSSPHARGTRSARLLYRRVNGSSPHARGTLLSALLCSAGQSVHPRMRGERSLALRGAYLAPVHPRMRGERSSR